MWALPGSASRSLPPRPSKADARNHPLPTPFCRLGAACKAWQHFPTVTRGMAMIRGLAGLLGVAALAVLSGATANSADERPPVDVELVLAVDISYSMDYDELALQREGYILALTSEQFIDALRRGPLGRIAVTYVEWAGSGEQQIVVPWQVIDSPASADAYAEKLRGAPIRRAYRTSISGALKFSAELFGTNFKGIRRVIDVSGDGTNNQGDLVEPNSRRCIAQRNHDQRLADHAEDAARVDDRSAGTRRLLRGLRNRRAWSLSCSCARATSIRRRNPQQAHS